MRPLRLELAGFTAFAEPVEIDFADADYFALVGPTGAGKSSIIDAMTFALYGSIPRLNVGSVHPVVAQGRQEARVRFDFAIGERTFTAVRVVRKLGEDRATTKEARLESGDEVLAGDADSVSAEVERLLGLGFEEFTRCVVLPQGDFARFMHDKPAARQDLLVKLLDLDIYERMAQRANQRAVADEARAEGDRRRLEDLAFASDESLKAARAQTNRLAKLQERIEAEEPKLIELRETVRAARERAVSEEKAAGLLERIQIPEDVADLAAAVVDATTLVESVDEKIAVAETAVKQADARLASLPERARLEVALESHKQLTKLSKELMASQKIAVKLEKDVAKLAKAAAAAETSAHDAQHVLDAARLQHRASDLARELVAGDPCPVCRQNVATLPKLETPADLDTADAAVTKALKAQKLATEAATEGERELATARARAATLEDQVQQLAEALEAHPDVETLNKDLAAIAAAEAALKSARADEVAARKTASSARAALEAANRQIKSARRTLDGARDLVADLSPPPLAHDDLAADWATFADWATSETPRRRAAAIEANEVARAAEDEGRSIVDAQKRACEEAGIEDVGNPRDDCLKALERARELIDRIEIALETAKEIAQQVRALDERAVVARALGGHLKANAFERWVLRQALTTLVDGATGILLELSAGQYSLTLDKQFNFAVIDHRNADARRSAKTLSGGETFLASLALALAMSDRIAQLSANTAVRLESIFLDEGFGSLDPETLEIVATAIETLGRTSRVVGLVTHVRDLADRIPVRFEVRKGPTTSTVEKVLA
jgi:exonuclease SbcC